MTITIIAAAVAIAVAGMLSFTAFARSDQWRATVTPLASIIGSGFLISGPILANEFGSLALPAMAVLLLVAYAVGGVIRFNIVHVEEHLASPDSKDPVVWTARGTQAVLALAYAVSVAYYLKLLAEFALKPLAISAARAPLVANIAVTVLILGIAAVAHWGGARRVETLAERSVSIKIGIIAGMLVALAIWWVTHAGSGEPVPPAKLSIRSIPLLLGLLITVQGFETSRYLGALYPAALRIRTMRHAQLIASAIYLAFLALLTPFLASAAKSQGVAGIVDVMGLVALPLTAFVLIGALASQLSAAVADSIGSAGLLNEVSDKRLSLSAAFVATSALAIAVVWLTDPFEVVAVASRAFALFYALQCVLAVEVSRRNGTQGTWTRLGFAALGLVCIVAALIGAPAEG